MRVTENSNYETVRDSINRSKTRMENLQRQQATLKKLNTPSDDPIGSAKLLEIRTDKVNNNQFGANGKLAEAYLNNSDHALGVLADTIVRAKEIALSQASGASSNDDTRIGVSEEVTQLFQQAVAAANTRIGDRYVFGGFKTNHPPIDPEGKYRGDDGEIMVEVAKDVFLTTNIPGSVAFNTQYTPSKPGSAPENSRKGHDPEVSGRGLASVAPENDEMDGKQNVNLFDELQNLRTGLLTGDLGAVRDTLERFDQIHGQLIAMRAKIGSRIHGLESTAEANEKHNITNAMLSSAIEDADMAQVVSDLAKEETVFRSALHSSQKLIQPSLMDFLK